MDGQDYADPNSRDALRRYRERYALHARSPETLGWRPATQEIRFAAFHAGFAIHVPASLVDIGCGFGDLLPYLRERGWSGRYLGIDIVPEFIVEARARFAGDAGAAFECADFLECHGELDYEAAFASGVLNFRREPSHEAQVERFLQAMAKVAQRYLAVDFLSDTADRRRPELAFHDPGWILRLGLSLSKRVQLDHAYMPYEFMLKVWFPDSVPADFPVFPGAGHDV